MSKNEKSNKLELVTLIKDYITILLITVTADKRLSVEMTHDSVKVMNFSHHSFYYLHLCFFYWV